MLLKGNYDGVGVLDVVREINWLKLNGIDATAEKPSGLVLQANSAGTLTDYYIWIDSSGNMRMHTSKPTDEDAQGDVITGASNAGASKAMDNLASVAINTSLVSDTDSTDDLGSSSVYWANGYIDTLYLGAAETIDGTTSNKIILNATTAIEYGVDDDGVDVKFFGATSGSYMLWDESADDLILTDGSHIKFGDSSDILLDFDGTNFDLDAVADDTIFQIGAASDVDVRFVSHDNSNYDAGWIADSYTFQLCDHTVLHMGGGAFDTVTDGFTLSFDASNTLNIDPVTANDVVRLGETTVGDLYLDGASYDCTWDGSASSFIFNDNASIAFGSSSDFVFSYDGSDFLIEPAAANDGFVFGATTQCDITINGATAGSDVTWDASADTWSFLDDVKCAFGDSDDMYFLYASGNTLSLLQTVAGTGSLLLGVDGKGVDTKFFSENSGDYVMWDQDGNSNTGALLFEDAVIQIAGANVTYTQGISTDELLFDGTDHANCGITFGTTGTNGLDVTFQSITSGDTVVFDAGAKTMTYTDCNLVIGEEYIQFYDSNVKLSGATDGQLTVTADTEVDITTTTVDLNGALDVSGTSTLTGAVTCSAGVQAAAVSRVPTADGTGTGLIADGTTMVTVTDGANANCWLTLPTPTPGNVVWLLTSGDSTGFEVRTDTPASVAINGGSEANAESAIGAAITAVRFVCLSATEWLGSQFDADGDESKVEAAAA